VVTRYAPCLSFAVNIVANDTNTIIVQALAERIAVSISSERHCIFFKARSFTAVRKLVATDCEVLGPRVDHLYSPSA
jgi:hypothetical protein